MTATTLARGSLRAPARSPRPAHLRLVRSEVQAARRTRRRVGLGVSVVVLTILTVVMFHVLLAQSQIRLDQIERRTAAAAARYQQERFRYEQLTAPPRLVPQALELGLVLPDQPPTAVTVPAADIPVRDSTTKSLGRYQSLKQTLSP